MELIGQGRNRIVYRHKGIVIKIPLNECGQYDNWHESRLGGISQKNKIYAKCRLINIGGWEVLAMVYVEHRGHSIEPDWTWGVDCGQVGNTKKGQLVAYDYGLY